MKIHSCFNFLIQESKTRRCVLLLSPPYWTWISMKMHVCFKFSIQESRTRCVLLRPPSYWTRISMKRHSCFNLSVHLPVIFIEGDLARNRKKLSRKHFGEPRQMTWLSGSGGGGDWAAKRSGVKPLSLFIRKLTRNQICLLHRPSPSRESSRLVIHLKNYKICEGVLLQISSNNGIDRSNKLVQIGN